MDRLYKKIALALAAAIALASCDGHTTGATPAPGAASVRNATAAPDTWAFYWYLCGSNLETNDASATADLNEMFRVSLPANVNVVIETGGAKQWHNGIAADANSRYVYNSGGFTLLERNPRSNMGDSSTLKNFLTFCNENYPADHRAVFIWNHGGGSVTGAAFDELYDMDSLTLTEMRAAFEASGTDAKYDLVGFDTCLMATIDTVNTFSPYADWLVASEETEPGGGWDYTAVFQASADRPDISGEALGKVICDSFYAACALSGEATMATLSVIDLSKAPALIRAYNDVGTEALTCAGRDADFFIEFGRAARTAENYGGNNNTEGYTNMVDIGDLMRKSGDHLLPKSGAALLEAVENAVAYQVKGALRGSASGISCYYSYNGDREDFRAYAALNTSAAFRSFYDYQLSGEFSADSPSGLPVTIDQNGCAILDVGAKTAKQLTGVYFDLAYMDEKRNMAVFLGMDNGLKEDWKNGVFREDFQGIWGSIDGTLVYMEISEETGDYQIYSIPILLNGEKYILNVSHDRAAKKYKIMGARHAMDGNGMADKNFRQLKPGDIIEPLHYVVRDVESTSAGYFEQIAVERIIVTERTAFSEISLGDGRFLFMFEMRDLQNKSYFSEAVVFSVRNGKITVEE